MEALMGMTEDGGQKILSAVTNFLKPTNIFSQVDSVFLNSIKIKNDTCVHIDNLCRPTFGCRPTLTKLYVWNIIFIDILIRHLNSQCKRKNCQYMATLQHNYNIVVDFEKLRQKNTDKYCK